MSNNNIPERKDVPSSDKWDLTTLFKSDDDWEKALAEILPDAEAVETYKGKLGQSKETLLEALKLYEKLWKDPGRGSGTGRRYRRGGAGDQAGVRRVQPAGQLT